MAQIALTILQLVALTFTADVMLLQLISRATAHYPDRAIRRIVVAAALIVVAGILAAIQVLYSAPFIISASIISVILSFLMTIAALYPIKKVEQTKLENEEEVDL